MGPRLVVMLALVLVVGGTWEQGDAVAAQGDTEGIYDLAAMTLVPGDVEESGYGFHASADLTRDAYAAEVNRIQQGDEDAQEEIGDALEEADWRRSYFSRLGAVRDDDPDFFRKVVFVRLTQYADADGAADGFALFDDAFADVRFTAVGNAPSYGDQSAVVRYEGQSSDTNLPYDELNLVFQSDDLVVELYVWDYTNDAPALSELSGLAEALEARIARVRDGEAPGLSLRVLRLDGDGITDYHDFYRQRDQEVFPFYNEPADALSAEKAAMARARITDMYFLAQTIPPEASDDDPVFNYRVTLYRFGSASAARNWLTTYPRDFVADPPAGFENVEAVADAARFGERSTTLAHDHLVGADTLHGYTVYLLVGDVVGIVAFEGAPGVTLSAIETLAEGQADCLDEGCLDRAPVPEDFTEEA